METDLAWSEPVNAPLAPRVTDLAGAAGIVDRIRTRLRVAVRGRDDAIDLLLIALLAVDGTLVQVGMPEHAMEIAAPPVVSTESEFAACEPGAIVRFKLPNPLDTAKSPFVTAPTSFARRPERSSSGPVRSGPTTRP